MKKFYDLLRSIIRRHGYDVHYYRKMALMRAHNIDCVLDVGANQGQFSTELRTLGFKDSIISFEPLPSAFSKLQKLARRDPNWLVFNKGLGDVNGILQLNESANSYSSSFLPITDRHIKEAAKSSYIGSHHVEVQTLDDFFTPNLDRYKNIYLKIDTQGFEIKVIQGALKSLDFISLIQMELSLEELYEGEKVMLDMCCFMYDLGFKMISLEPGFTSVSGEMLQCDVYFSKINYTI